jgi:ferredoxin
MDECELVSISKVFNEDYAVDGEKIGFVFPVYAWSMPRFVEDFISKLSIKHTPYIFAVATCAEIAGNTMGSLNKLLKKKGFSLGSGFISCEKSNSIEGEENNIFVNIMHKTRGDRENISIDDRLELIVDTIIDGKEKDFEKDSSITNALSPSFHKMATGIFKKIDKHFWTNDDCNGCATCVRICPRNNIAMVDKRPVWNGDCESCRACFHACPKKALQFGDDSSDVIRYRKEGITLKELL